jgi:hypothetical protein
VILWEIVISGLRDFHPQPVSSTAFSPYLDAALDKDGLVVTEAILISTFLK